MKLAPFSLRIAKALTVSGPVPPTYVKKFSVAWLPARPPEKAWAKSTGTACSCCKCCEPVTAFRTGCSRLIARAGRACDPPFAAWVTADGRAAIDAFTPVEGATGAEGATPRGD